MMDIETEKIIALLFPDGIPESWHRNPDFYQYLVKIGGYDVDGLNKEPDHLLDEKRLIEHSTQDLVFSNYKTFIQTAEISQAVNAKFKESEQKLDAFLEKLPHFIEKCKSFCKVSKDINTQRKLNTLTLSKTSELLEILELPHLMECCLKNEQYSEALELSQYARHLGIKHSNIPIIANVVNEIENSWSLMVNQVIQSLKADLPLPKCLQLIGLLRSMNAFTESELRIKFLQARDSWLQILLKSIPTDDATIHLTKTIELSRIHLFNIITQYKAMFNDDDHLTLRRDMLINDSAIFYQWLEEKVFEFLLTLERDLPNVTSLDSILGQCTYFGLSFGRVGADFTSRMSDVFLKVIKNKYQGTISKATQKFERDINAFTIMNKNIKSEAKIEIINSENPPDQLLEYYPLAEYCNALIESFNEVRVNTPVAVAQDFTYRVENSLKTAAKSILNVSKKKQQKSSQLEREHMTRFVECFSEQLVPYIQFCIHTLFPSNQVAMHFGISVSQLQKEGITYLKTKDILEPISSLLPEKNFPDIFSSGGICSLEDKYSQPEIVNENRSNPQEVLLDNSNSTPDELKEQPSLPMSASVSEHSPDCAINEKK